MGAAADLGTADAGPVDAAETAKFEAMAADWWDPNGALKPLHRMQPCRLDYVTAQIAAEHGRDLRARRPFEGLTLLDIGCGGGLLAEPMARLGAAVTGIDPAEGNLPVARLHAAQSGLAVDYRAATAEGLAAEGARFDVILCMEVLEHAPDPAGLLAAAGRMLTPGGVLVASTLNRTRRAWALAIVAAERVLRWLPPGTHDWQKFVTPEELAAMLAAAGLEPVDRQGFVYDPLRDRWRTDARDLSINHVATAVKPA